MTIQGLSDFLKRKGVSFVGKGKDTDEGQYYYLDQLSGQKIAIEVASLIYKELHGAMCEVTDKFRKLQRFAYNPETGWNEPPIEMVYDEFRLYMTRFVKKIIATKIKPIFIMEGKCPELKLKTSQKRYQDKVAKKKFADSARMVENLEHWIIAYRKSVSPNKKHTEITLEVLKSLEVTILQSEYEAEGVCGQLVSDRTDPYHCLTAICDDYDITMYGANIVLKGIKSGGKYGSVHVMGYVLSNILQMLGFMADDHKPDTEEYKTAFRRYQLLCILSGTDYSDRIPNMGPSRILDLILKKNIQSYEDMCEADERFINIPYQEIISCLDDNRKYSVIQQSPVFIKPVTVTG